jgi:hypothetical protein
MIDSEVPDEGAGERVTAFADLGGSAGSTAKFEVHGLGVGNGMIKCISSNAELECITIRNLGTKKFLHSYLLFVLRWWRIKTVGSRLHEAHRFHLL